MEQTEQQSLKHMTCPQCKKAFQLTWNDYTNIGEEYLPQTLTMRGCPSGGVYDVFISCPHCDYEEAL